MPREKKSKKAANNDGEDGPPPAAKKKRRSSNVASAAANAANAANAGQGPGGGAGGRGTPGSSDLAPIPSGSFGETMYAGNPFDDFGSQSLPGPGTPGTPGPQLPMGQMPPQGVQHMGPHHPGPPNQHPQGKPVPMMSGKIYPHDQPRVSNPANPNAPPIYPCGVCHKEVHDNDQAILCESGCNFWFHRGCTGLSDYAYVLLNEEIYAEWACDRCLQTKPIPLVKFKP